jgi:hypothetical protein
MREDHCCLLSATACSILYLQHPPYLEAVAYIRILRARRSLVTGADVFTNFTYTTFHSVISQHHINFAVGTVSLNETVNGRLFPVGFDPLPSKREQ